MSDIAIKVEEISKKYLIGHQVSTSLADKFKSLLGYQKTGSQEEFWALQNVSFEIKKGEAVGIIGKNGAGKSTLLKVLSRITHPTSGRFEMNGRVSSLLEVGTGFHPELSGRENIYLNGTILGMSRQEIKSKFDEIVAFSGVEKFLDTPVKHYSSGMYVRLAFSVAAHLEPEILIIDEVLAVGDAEFQKKCLGKMDEVAKEGRTVLFVSHNMDAVQKLCNVAIHIKNGLIERIGETDSVIGDYLKIDHQVSSQLKVDNRRGTGLIKFESIELLNENGDRLQHLTIGSPCLIGLNMVSDQVIDLDHLQIDVGIDNDRSRRVAWFSTLISQVSCRSKNSKEIRVILKIEKIPFYPGNYVTTLFAKYKGETVDWLGRGYSFEVVDGDFFGAGKLTGSPNAPLLIDHSFIYEESR